MGKQNRVVPDQRSEIHRAILLWYQLKAQNFELQCARANAENAELRSTISTLTEQLENAQAAQRFTSSLLRRRRAQIAVLQANERYVLSVEEALAQVLLTMNKRTFRPPPVQLQTFVGAYQEFQPTITAATPEPLPQSASTEGRQAPQHSTRTHTAHDRHADQQTDTSTRTSGRGRIATGPPGTDEVAVMTAARAHTASGTQSITGNVELGAQRARQANHGRFGAMGRFVRRLRFGRAAC